MGMLINSLLLLSAILLITSFYLSNVSATQSRINNITSGNETNLPNSTFLSPPWTVTNHSSNDNESLMSGAPPPRVEDFSFENRVIP